MSLIIEACDCAGKTTLLGKILGCALKRLSMNRAIGYGSLEVQHFGRLPETFDYYLDYLNNIGINTISDRFFFSELVYGPIMRGHVSEKFDWMNQTMVSQELLVQGSLVVRCTAPFRVIEERYAARGDEYIKNLETMKLIVNDFENLDLHSFVGSNFLNVDTSTPVPDEIIERIVDAWFKNRERALEYRKIGAGWGSLDEGKVLVIGERPGKDYAFAPQYHCRPFAVPNPIKRNHDVISSSTEWVMRMLRDSGLKPADYHITNVYHSSLNETKLDEEIEFLKPEKIVVMGNIARQVVKDIGVDKTTTCFFMPHPQYLRRFHQKRYNEFLAHFTNFVKSDFLTHAVKEWSV